MCRRLRQLRTGMLLTAPAGRQWPTADQPHTRVDGGKLLHDRVGAVGRGIVEHDQFQIDVLTGKDRPRTWCDRRRLVACRHQHRDLRHGWNASDAQAAGGGASLRLEGRIARLAPARPDPRLRCGKKYLEIEDREDRGQRRQQQGCHGKHGDRGCVHHSRSPP